MRWRARSLRRKWDWASSAGGAANKLRRFRQRLARVGLDALDHRAQAVGALRCQMLAEAELLEHGERIGRKNFLRRAAGEKRQHDRDQAAHDVRVAVAAIVDARLALAAID